MTKQLLNKTQYNCQGKISYACSVNINGISAISFNMYIFDLVYHKCKF